MRGMCSFATRTCARATSFLLAQCAPVLSRLARGAEGNLSNLSNGCACQRAHPPQRLRRGWQRTKRTGVGMARHQPYCPLPRTKATAKSGSNPPPTTLNLLPTRTHRGTCARARPTRTHTHTSYIHTRIHIHILIHIHFFIRACVCLCVCLPLCTHTHTHTHMHIYPYISRSCALLLAATWQDAQHSRVPFFFFW